MTFDQVRRIRNFTEVCWDRRIHEQIFPAIRRARVEIVKTAPYTGVAGAVVFLREF